MHPNATAICVSQCGQCLVVCSHLHIHLGSFLQRTSEFFTCWLCCPSKFWNCSYRRFLVFSDNVLLPQRWFLMLADMLLGLWFFSCNFMFTMPSLKMTSVAHRVLFSWANAWPLLPPSSLCLKVLDFKCLPISQRWSPSCISGLIECVYIVVCYWIVISGWQRGCVYGSSTNRPFSVLSTESTVSSLSFFIPFVRSIYLSISLSLFLSLFIYISFLFCWSLDDVSPLTHPCFWITSITMDPSWSPGTTLNTTNPASFNHRAGEV